MMARMMIIILVILIIIIAQANEERNGTSNKDDDGDKDGKDDDHHRRHHHHLYLMFHSLLLSDRIPTHLELLLQARSQRSGGDGSALRTLTRYPPNERGSSNLHTKKGSLSVGAYFVLQ